MEGQTNKARKVFYFLLILFIVMIIIRSSGYTKIRIANRYLITNYNKGVYSLGLVPVLKTEAENKEFVDYLINEKHNLTSFLDYTDLRIYMSEEECLTYEYEILNETIKTFCTNGLFNPEDNIIALGNLRKNNMEFTFLHEIGHVIWKNYTTESEREYFIEESGKIKTTAVVLIPGNFIPEFYEEKTIEEKFSNEFALFMMNKRHCLHKGKQKMFESIYQRVLGLKISINNKTI